MVLISDFFGGKYSRMKIFNMGYGENALVKLSIDERVK